MPEGARQSQPEGTSRAMQLLLLPRRRSVTSFPSSYLASPEKLVLDDAPCQDSTGSTVHGAFRRNKPSYKLPVSQPTMPSLTMADSSHSFPSPMFKSLTIQLHPLTTPVTSILRI